MDVHGFIGPIVLHGTNETSETASNLGYTLDLIKQCFCLSVCEFTSSVIAAEDVAHSLVSVCLL